MYVNKYNFVHFFLFWIGTDCSYYVLLTCYKRFGLIAYFKVRTCFKSSYFVFVNEGLLQQNFYISTV